MMYVYTPTNGEEETVYKLVSNYSSTYDKEEGMVVIKSRRIATLYKRGLDFRVEHENDTKGGVITLDLPISYMRGCSARDAMLFFKCFEKIERTINTDLNWCLL